MSGEAPEVASIPGHSSSCCNWKEGDLGRDQSALVVV